jgi:NAD-dependent dihydropyrimidine dehydrogenase PreA subunit
MSQHLVHADRCKRDGLCVIACPIGVLHQSSPEAVPAIRPEAANDCVDCGH